MKQNTSKEGKRQSVLNPEIWSCKLVRMDRVSILMKEHGLPDERIDHSVKVADLALRISDLMIDDGMEVDKALVEKGALLHDVGYL